MYQTRDDMMLTNFQNTNYALRNLQQQLNQPGTNNNELLEWTPLIALRHTAQQIMIRNLATQPESRSNIRNSRLSFLTTSSTSGESLSSSPPITPLCTEFWNELGVDTTITGDRSSLSPIRPCSSSIISSESQTINNKSGVQSSLKAAKLLGIDGITNIKSKSRPKSNFSRSFSTTIINRTSSVPSSPTKLKSMVDGLFKKPTCGIYLKSLLPRMSKHSWLEFQIIRSSLFSSHFKHSFIICCDRTLYRFSNDDPTSIPTHHLTITSNLKISTQKDQLTLSDSSQMNWCLRFKDSNTLNLWATQLQSLSISNLPDHRLSLPPHPSNSYRFTLPFRPKSIIISKHLSRS